jgi:Tfp pilus assembly protein PilF
MNDEGCFLRGRGAGIGTGFGGQMSIEGHLDPVYSRGRAYLQQGNGNAAAAEFRKIIEHPGLVVENPIGSLAHLGLAHAYALEGDRSKSALYTRAFSRSGKTPIRIFRF